jgi:hypothetical protein
MEGEQTKEESYDQTFIEQPAILDKHKAAAAIVDGKYKNQNLTTNSVMLSTLPINSRRMALYKRNR